MHVQSIVGNTPTAIPDNVLKIEYASSQDGMKDWALLRPSRNNKVWVVCIHGHGSQGDQLYTRPDMRDGWLPIFKANNFGILTPNLRGNAWMSPMAVSDMHDLINYVRSRYSVEKFIFFSGSMGGTSNLIYSLFHPKDIAAMVALGAASDLCSYYLWCKQRDSDPVLKDISTAIEFAYKTESENLNTVLKKCSVLENDKDFKVPLFLAHGEADEIIPVEQSRKLAEKLADLAQFQYLEIPGGSHDSPLYVVDDAMKWLSDGIYCAN